MKKYLNVKDGTILTEEEFDALRKSDFEDVSEKWQEDGFYNRSEYIKALGENFNEEDYVEVQPYRIYASMIGPEAVAEDLRRGIEWLRNHGIECELTESPDADNRYAERPSPDLWNQMLEEIFGQK